MGLGVSIEHARWWKQILNVTLDSPSQTFLAKQDALIVSNVRPYLMQLSQQLLQ